MADLASSSCPDLPDADGYGFSAEQIDYIGQNNQTILKLIRDLQRDLSVGTRYQTQYLDLPLSSMFKATPGTAGTLALMGVSTGTTLGFYSGLTTGWSTLALLATNQATTPNTVASRWHCNFRLPGSYEAGTNIALYLAGACVETLNGSAASAHTIDLAVYRSRT